MNVDKFGDAFAEFMEPDEHGTPLLSRTMLGEALEAAGFHREVAPMLMDQMDPHHTGNIEFSDFIAVLSEICDAPDDHHNMKSMNSQRSSSGNGKAASDGTQSETLDIFQLLSGGRKVLTVEGLMEAARKLQLKVPTEDLETMLRTASSNGDSKITADEFANLWTRLDNVLGSEIGT